MLAIGWWRAIVRMGNGERGNCWKHPRDGLARAARRQCHRERWQASKCLSCFRQIYPLKALMIILQRLKFLSHPPQYPQSRKAWHGLYLHIAMVPFLGWKGQYRPRMAGTSLLSVVEFQLPAEFNKESTQPWHTTLMAAFCVLWVIDLLKETLSGHSAKDFPRVTLLCTTIMMVLNIAMSMLS